MCGTVSFTKRCLFFQQYICILISVSIIYGKIIHDYIRVKIEKKRFQGGVTLINLGGIKKRY